LGIFLIFRFQKFTNEKPYFFTLYSLKFFWAVKFPKLQGLIIDIGGSGVKDTLILGVPEVNISFLLPLGCFFYIACFGFGVYKRKFI
tara:strand:+ start:1500 stop:1760 length:261 start_codon:yes stop_codon:yes gene_type:complete